MSQSLQYHKVSWCSFLCSNGNDVVLDLLWGNVPDRSVFWLVGMVGDQAFSCRISNELFCKVNSKVFTVSVLEVCVKLAEYVTICNSYIKQKPRYTYNIFYILVGHGSTP